MVQFTGYCVKCGKKKTIDGKTVVKTTKRGKTKFLTGKCGSCGTSVWRIVGKA